MKFKNRSGESYDVVHPHLLSLVDSLIERINETKSEPSEENELIGKIAKALGVRVELLVKSAQSGDGMTVAKAVLPARASRIVDSLEAMPTFIEKAIGPQSIPEWVRLQDAGRYVREFGRPKVQQTQQSFLDIVRRKT